jgi:hypothetical protein
MFLCIYSIGLLSGLLFAVIIIFMTKGLITNQHNGEEEVPGRFKGSTSYRTQPELPTQELEDAEADEAETEE